MQLILRGVTHFSLVLLQNISLYIFIPGLSSFEFHNVTNFFKLVFLQNCKEVHLHMIIGFLFSEMLIPIGLLGA